MLGIKISTLRKQKGYSQAELGTLLGVSNKAVSKWENDDTEPDLSMLLNLSRVLGVTTDELLDNNKSINKNQGHISNMNYEGVLTFNLINDGSAYEVARITKKPQIRADETVSSFMSSIPGISIKGIINIPAVYEGKPVIKIAEKAFYMCPNMEGVVIPQSVEIIGDSAFSGCKAMTEIVLPDGVTAIGKFAFMKCDRLQTVKLPESIKVIGDNAFVNCPELAEINIPSGVSFCRPAFFGCKKLKELNFTDASGKWID